VRRGEDRIEERKRGEERIEERKRGEERRLMNPLEAMISQLHAHNI
jgi:hypothetical protein